jgi:hypothetical protein
MTTAGLGMFAYGAAIGWLSILFIVPPISSNWRALAVAAVLWSGCILLCWWYGGIFGAGVAAPGLAAGALGAIAVRFDHVFGNN